MRKFPTQEMKLRGSAKYVLGFLALSVWILLNSFFFKFRVGTFGFVTEYGAEKKISKYSSLVASVMIGVPSGVTLKVKYIRSTQSYIFPIHLSEEVIPAAVIILIEHCFCIFEN